MEDINTMWDNLSKAAKALNEATDAFNREITILQKISGIDFPYEIWDPEFTACGTSILQVGFKDGEFQVRSKDGKYTKRLLDTRRETRVALMGPVAKIAKIIFKMKSPE